MKQHLRFGGGLFTGAAVAILAQAPAWAIPTQVTGVQVSQANGGVSIILATEKGDRPQVLTISSGNTFQATILNTQLRLPQGDTFRQENPGPGIVSVELVQLDANSIRLVVTGTASAPTGQVVQGAGPGIAISIAQGRGTAASIPISTAPPPLAGTNTTPVPGNPSPTAQTPPVLVPNPPVTITRTGEAPLPSDVQSPLNQAPPFLPRAVAPPVGDIAVSNVDPSASSINLGTVERIPRLVLRDAPVRDVLALLARAAGLNIAFTFGASTQPGQAGQAAPPAQPGQPQAASGGTEGPKISLDIENESVQDVFNYVLRLSGLQANRNGRTIFVGTTLPVESRNVIVRTLRLNQVQVSAAEGFLAAQGAEVQRVVQTITRERGNPQTGDPAREITSPPTLTALTATQGAGQTGPLLLRGMSVVSDSRLNSITLIGEPRKVDIAVAFLTQLDLRRRQVAVNVKVVDVNLSGQNNTSTSFSFGINNSFFVNDNGAASLNFGGINPPSANNGSNPTTSVLARPVITNPITGTPFYDPNNLVTVPLTAPGGGLFVRPVAPVTSNPTQVGITNYTSFTRDLTTGALTAVGDATFGLYPLFQYPKRFLSLLQGTIQSGNAKILTDPTLVVQEGETARVNLTQQVVGNVTTQTTASTGSTQTTFTAVKEDAGLILAVQVERVDDNGFVSMRLVPRVRAIGGTQNLGTNQIALLQERSLDSGLIRLRDGQTLIVSGIIQDQERVTANKIPILGDLPIIGALFRSTTKNNQRAEVIVLVTPQVMDDSDRSPFGYQYNPSPDARQLLQRGLPIQPRQ